MEFAGHLSLTITTGGWGLLHLQKTSRFGFKCPIAAIFSPIYQRPDCHPGGPFAPAFLFSQLSTIPVLLVMKVMVDAFSCL